MWLRENTEQVSFLSARLLQKPISPAVPIHLILNPGDISRLKHHEMPRRKLGLTIGYAYYGDMVDGQSFPDVRTAPSPRYQSLQRLKPVQVIFVYNLPTSSHILEVIFLVYKVLLPYNY